MSDGESFYTFLPWLRTGVGAGLAHSPDGTSRASVDLQLHILGDDAIQDTIHRNVELYGPGDVLGVNPNTIIRTVPPRGTRDYESNFLAAIEFYDEDFPWRYSPTAPEGDRVAPWLWLLVLEEGEFDLLQSVAQVLPVVRLHEGVMNNAFPKVQQTWAWAHTHLNFKIGDENGDLQAALNHAQTQLSANPNLGCSRLICPRRLKEDTGYTAFLIPAFEKGRLAGLGADLHTVETTPATRLSWEPHAASPNQFPIYYQWSFSTMKGGDFEQLASKIRPANNADLIAAGVGAPLAMDIHSPGWGVSHQDPNRTVAMPSVFLLFSSPADPEFPAPGSVSDNAWVDGLARLLNLSVDMQEARANINQPNPIYNDAVRIGDDPIVTPPLYGSWYVPPPIDLDKTKIKTHWFHQMNLHPGLRVMGGAGAEVIRDNQEEYMERAWEQCEEIRETNRFISMAQLSSRASTAMVTKHFGSALESFTSMTPSNQQVRGLRLAAMARSAGVFETGHTRSEVHSWASPVAMKMFRPNGALMTRVAATGHSASVENTWLNDQQVEAYHYENDDIGPLDIFLMDLTNKIIFNPNDPSTGNLIAGMVAEKVQGALDTHKEYFFFLVSILFVPVRLLATNISEQFQPGDAIARKVNSLLPETARTDSPTSSVEFVHIDPEFSEPMFEELARQSLDLIIPGIEKFPVDRCGIFRSNRNAVEAFLVGLNHEMAREMLWREFPANLTSTSFRQFWDKSDLPTNTPENAKFFKDISPVQQWGSTPLGHGTHRVGTNVDPLFFVLRGDLLRKYPNTVVFMQRAKIENGLKVPDDESSDAIRMPVASARIEPDIFFVGFNVFPPEAVADPGWFIVLQERPGDIHFGLDQNESGVPPVLPTDPHWKNADTAPGQCIDTDKPLFANLRHAADVASFTHQKPFMLAVHASRMLG